MGKLIQKSVFNMTPVNKANNYPQILIYSYVYMFIYGYLGKEESTGGYTQGNSRGLFRVTEEK